MRQGREHRLVRQARQAGNLIAITVTGFDTPEASRRVDR